ncbi:fibronectin type III domain-containing protein, partial [Clostridium saudiense]|nr:fibronectin type III domain-containing protein [Clostridium saudiense]
VTEDSADVINPNKSTLFRGSSYTIKNLEDNTAYEVRVTATNHLGTSKMSNTYIAKTTSVIPPVMPEYKLINRPTDENEIGSEHIIDVRNKLDADGWSTSDDRLHYDSEYALVDGDFTTSWKVNDWDTGSEYGANRGSEITFDDTYQIGTIAFAETLEQGYPMSLWRVKVTYWDEDGVAKVVRPTSLQTKTSNGHRYYIVKLDEPITTHKIKVDTAGYAGSVQTMSEIRFYEYDSLADDIKALYTDYLRLVLKDEVNQEVLDNLKERLNTPDPVSNEYHPDKAILEKELEVAQLLYNDREISEKITTLDASIRNDNEGPSLGMQNDWQSLGSVARPGVDEDGTSNQIVVYMGSSDPNTQVQITFLQNYGLPGEYQGGTVTIKPGRTEITIPSIISADVEKGGQVMARVVKGSTTADVKIRLSGVTEIPHLNVNNIINDSNKVDEVKGKIRTYIE